MDKQHYKYFTSYAEPEINAFQNFPYQYDHVLAIPVFNENDYLPKLLENLPATKNVLIILVINAQNNSNKEIFINNASLVEKLKTAFPVVWQNDLVTPASLGVKDGRSILFIDKSTKGYRLEPKHGVGLARKIACDIASYLISCGKIKSPWIHSTDADVMLPEDYFSRIFDLNAEISAAIYPFKHEQNTTPRLNQAITLYEEYLNHYVRGLEFAGSPYAFHTIGSTLLINADAYCKVRGFPKREAGEDFYLLNKLRKVGEVVNLRGNPIKIATRLSDRVPFGTGPALNKYVNSDDADDVFPVYSEKVFRYLKLLLTFITEIELKDDQDQWQEKLLQHCQAEGLQYETLLLAMRQLEMFDAISTALEKSKTQKIFQKHIHDWFDAFRTLKLLRIIRAETTEPTIC